MDQVKSAIDMLQQSTVPEETGGKWAFGRVTHRHFDDVRYMKVKGPWSYRIDRDYDRIRPCEYHIGKNGISESWNVAYEPQITQKHVANYMKFGEFKDPRGIHALDDNELDWFVSEFVRELDDFEEMLAKRSDFDPKRMLLSSREKITGALHRYVKAVRSIPIEKREKYY